MMRILDTYPDFLAYWEKYQDRDIEEQVRGWADEYMFNYPELLDRQKKDYRDMELDWREVAAERVFPHLGERVEQMSRARSLLSVVIEPVHKTAADVFEMDDLEILYVIYVGIGCGAGWVTGLEGSPAVLLGLENIAECGWTEADSLKGLVAHELGHAIHGLLRNDPELAGGGGPFWQLYTEGFAQRCEHRIMDRDSWSVGKGLNSSDWLQWCHSNRSWLAGEFLQAVEMEEDVRPFFGSWYQLRGRSHCGHYLGHQVILELEKNTDMLTIAQISDIESAITGVLETFITAG